MASLIRAYEQLISARDYDPTLHHLADLRAVEHFNVSSVGIRQLTRTLPRLDELRIQTKLAIVAEKDDVYGMARMYQTLRSDAPQLIQVFRDMEDAKGWLASLVAEA